MKQLQLHVSPPVSLNMFAVSSVDVKEHLQLHVSVSSHPRNQALGSYLSATFCLGTDRSMLPELSSYLHQGKSRSNKTCLVGEDDQELLASFLEAGASRG